MSQGISTPMTGEKRTERAAAAEHLRTLMRWGAEARERPLPEPVRRRAAIILADDIGAMTAGSLRPQVEQARAGFLRTARRAAAATVLARRAPRPHQYTPAA